MQQKLRLPKINMDFIGQLQKVKENIARWQKDWGENFDYLINDFATENEELGTINVYISKNEHRVILKYLAYTGFLEITKNGSDSPRITILPKTNPTIRLKSLELIAMEIGELDTGHNLVNFLIECGVDKRLIVYPNTKWRMVYAVLVELACSKNDRDEATLFKIIGDTIHPLIHGGNTLSAELLQRKFNTYLSYDNLRISYNKRGGVYEVMEPLSEDEKREIRAALDKKEKKRLEFLYQPENKEKITLLRKSYQALMGVVELFCRNFLRLSQEDIVELNKHYLSLDKTVWDIFDEFKLGETFENYRKYPRPFKNLFSAEKELDGDIDWDVIRREMSARFGEIEALYQRVNASDILAEPDKQKQLNDVMLYLSELKEKTKEAERESGIKEPSAARIEITKMPKLKIKGLEEKVVLQKPKNKRIQLRKFPADLKWEEISIQFLNEHEVIIKARNETLQTTYEAMGFQDEKRKLPNKQWKFLRLLSLKNGEISWENNQNLPLKQINSIKKQKQLLSEALKAYFQIHKDEPFHDYKTEKAYRIKINLTPEPESKDMDEQEIYNE